MRRISGSALTVAVLAFGSASGIAHASTTLGQTFAPTSGCGSSTLVQQSEGPGVPSYAVPAGGGVITSWSTEADSNTGQTAKFKVLRPTGAPNQYTVVAATATEALTPSTVNTFPARIPVQQGDRIGLFGGNDCLAPSTGSDVQFDNSDDAPGTTNTYPMAYAGVMDLSAKLEPDADGDGFGDETQDQCPTDPTTQAACQADLSITNTASPLHPVLGDTVTYSLEVKNSSAYNAAKAVSLTDKLPSNLAVVSATASTGSCSGATMVTCSLGDLAKGRSAVGTIVARTTKIGLGASDAFVSSATQDPNTANNSARAITFIGAPPYPGMTLARSGIVSAKGVATVKATCRQGVLSGCTAAIALTMVSRAVARPVASRAKKVLPVGSTTFRIPSGKTLKVTLKISKKALELLTQKHKLKTIATLTSHDGAGTIQTLSRKLTLKLKQRRH
jgi:uncharacterized repeat protein (TIGR01451 family)